MREIQIDTQIHYVRYEFLHPPEPTSASLLIMVYDIPYFGACGVFPPYPIINQIFAEGGSDGGMSPGATWDPFQINQETYQALLNQVRHTDPQSLKGLARYCFIQFWEDPSFDYIQDRMTWLARACKKHRERYHLEIAKHQS